MKMRSLDDTVRPAAAPAPAHPPPGVLRPRPAPGHAPRPRPRRCQGVAEGAWPGGADEVFMEIIITARPEIVNGQSWQQGKPSKITIV